MRQGYILLEAMLLGFAHREPLRPVLHCDGQLSPVVPGHALDGIGIDYGRTMDGPERCRVELRMQFLEGFADIGLERLGNLLYFPILPDWSRMLRISSVGSIAQEQIPGMQHKGGYYVCDSKAGLTTVMAVTFGPDGLLYALELADATGYPAPGLGKVVRLKRTGDWEDVFTGLNVPGGMTWGPDGSLYTSDFSAVPAPGFGAGRILRFNVAFGY